MGRGAGHGRGGTAADYERDIVADALPESDRAEFERLATARQLDEAAARRLAALLVPAFRDSGGADSELVAPSGGPAASDGVPGEADVLKLWSAVSAGRPRAPGQNDGASAFPPDEDEDDVPPEAALSLGWLDPRHIVRLATVRQMKDRAGVVGATGLAPVLGRLLEAGAANDTRVHLLGHSYGAKVVLSAALYAPATTKKISSMLLLQPAISCFAFGTSVFGSAVRGGYRPVLDRVAHPILATFSSRDRL